MFLLIWCLLLGVNSVGVTVLYYFVLFGCFASIPLIGWLLVGVVILFVVFGLLVNCYCRVLVGVVCCCYEVGLLFG